MSLYDDASLIMIPSGVKTGKVYSQKPMDSDGQFTFTRASEATRLVDGVVTKVRTNFNTYSQDFTNWAQSNILSITTSATANPLDGSLNAQDITVSTASGVHRVLQSVSGGLSSINAWSIYAKANGYGFITIVENGNTGHWVSFNLSAGAVSTESSAVGSIESLGDGWYRCEMRHTTLTTPRFDVYVSPTDSLAAYTGDGTSGVTLFAAQAEYGTVATDYIATTTVAVSEGPVANMPRLNSVAGGCSSLKLEPQRTNAITNSEYFDGYSKQNIDSITPNAAISPDGETNASKLIPNTSSAEHLIYQGGMGGSTAANTITIYAKAAGYNFLIIRIDSPTVRGFFNLSDGTLGTIGAGMTGSIESVGDGWYRCSATVSPSSTYQNAVISLAAVDNTQTFAGNGTDGILIYGWQSELGSYATSYIPNYGTTAGVTRVGDLANVSNTFLSGADDMAWFCDYVLPNEQGLSFRNQTGYRNNSDANMYMIQFPNSNTHEFRYRGVAGVNVDMTPSISEATYGLHRKVLFTKTGTTLKLFCNGIEVSTVTSSSATTFRTASETLAFGENYGAEMEINSFLLFSKGFTDAEAITLTTL